MGRKEGLGTFGGIVLPDSFWDFEARLIRSFMLLDNRGGGRSTSSFYNEVNVINKNLIEGSLVTTITYFE